MNNAQGKRPPRNLTTLEKLDAIQRVRNGSSKASVARDIGIPESTLRGWCKNEDKLRSVLAIKCENDAYGVPQKKRAKLDPYSPFNFTDDPKMNYLDMANTNGTSSGGTNLRHSDRGIGLQNLSSNLAAISSYIKCNENNIRNYGANNGYSSVEANSPSTTLSQSSGLSNVGQSPFGMSFSEIASNLNVMAQLNNQSANFGTGARFSNSQSNGLNKVRQKQISNSLRANNVVESQHKSSTMGHIGMDGVEIDVIDKPKQLSVASVSQDRPSAGGWSKHHRQVVDSVLPQYSSPLQQQHRPFMMPASISTPTRASTTLETTSSSSPRMSEHPLFWQLYSQLFSSMMNENLRNNANSSYVTKDMTGCSPSVNNNKFNNNNQNKVNDPDLSEQRQVTSSTSSPVANQKYRRNESNKAHSKFDAKVEIFRVGNNDEDVNVEIGTGYSDLNGISEAVEHGEKFLKWLETYSDPSITSMQVKQCRSLLQRVKTSVERVNN